MAHITAEDVKAIRAELKTTFPDAKFSVKKRHNMEVAVSILQSKHKFGDLLNHNGKQYTTASVNHYWIDTQVSTVSDKEFLFKIVDIIKTAPGKVTGRHYFDESDSQSDYFHTAYYFDIRIGTAEKPYVVA